MSRVHGADEFLKDLQKLGANMNAVEREMLRAGGEEMAQAWRLEIYGRGFVSDGKQNKNHMVDHIVWQWHKGKKSSHPAVEITAKGKDDHGVRHGAKAFFLHYGTSRGIPPSHWIDEAEETGMAMAYPKMKAVLDQALNSTIGSKK